MTTKTYRGRSLEELLPRVRAELGPDAVIVRQREGLTGGVGGFFQKRCVEIEAMAPEAVRPSVDLVDDSPATPDFLEQLSAAQTRAEEVGARGRIAPRAILPAEAASGGFGDFSGSSDFIPDAFAVPAQPVQPVADEAIELESTLDDGAWSDWATDAPGPAAPQVRPVIVEGVSDVPWPEGPQHHAPVPAPAALPVPHASASAAPAPLAVPMPAEIVPLRDAMVERGLEAPVADAVIEEAVTHLLPFAGAAAKPKAVLADALARRIPVRPLGGAAGRVIAFIGPGGAGKTHLAGHLAGTYARASGLPVSCVALRPNDAGAELALLLSPAGVPMQVASDAASAGAHAAALRTHALVLIDTPGVSPRKKGDLRTLHSELRAAGADEIVLALPATMSTGAARELVAAGKRVGASALALTHSDETEHLGPAIGVAMESGLPFAFVGQAANGRPAVRPAAADELAKALLASTSGAGRR